MEVVTKERLMVVPAKPIKKHRLFLSNVDLTLMAYYETVAFFKPLKARQLSLLEAFERLRVGLGEGGSVLLRRETGLRSTAMALVSFWWGQLHAVLWITWTT
ncbi:hypothetical protein AMTR_s00087p00149520 [Amborella trichopoda]|uniref:Uncharacterized protein n=1 Tax=Amborella trichopoda TaxID=13333 RepID=W1P4T6_AMBTC|nr:hypothetical protein AMTR_s00087p00149520 [Amborella trichopoda]